MTSSRDSPDGVDSTKDVPAERITKLSEANLRIHTAACQNNKCSVADLIPAEDLRAAKHDTYRQRFGDYDKLSDEDFSQNEVNLAARREASFDALKLYSGSFASPYTPMDRFIAASPTQEPHPWLARTALENVGVASGDSEEVDVQRLASEMTLVDPEPEGGPEAEIGSPRPSSDTYSLARCRETCLETTKEKKEQHRGTRNWKVVKMRKRKPTDRARKARNTPPTER
ncbi:hypothetical protein K458DRAFT_419249 [Lentithecium fluviatile CBS 122367]|uniref:Uncharacterized protein n=1 Tax=Lentithecium fluviatile CBS 122367 TaxID=1168545 RepID=A0A6G1IXP8_9PLEO|nr:hypothetical protein K458DRAFT_419249 [Lentithecium fluviatile CBS 122367]